MSQEGSILFSIVIPTYNREESLKKALESVSNQDYVNFECIVVDDGSTDDTRKLMLENCSKDKRFLYFYQDNQERCVARNVGIDKAQGQYICFLDSDDQYTKDHLAELALALEKHQDKPAMFFTNYLTNGKKTIDQIEVPEDLVEKTELLFTHSIIPDRVCIHSDILSVEKFDTDITIGEDAILWTRIAQNYPVVALPQTTVLYNLHDGNSINFKNNAQQKRLNGLKLFFNRYPKIKKKISFTIRSEMYSDIYLRIALYQVYRKNYFTAIRKLCRSILLSPFNVKTRYKLYLIKQLVVKNEAALENELIL